MSNPKAIQEVLDSHPAISTDEVLKRLRKYVEDHMDHPDEDLPMGKISPCIMISLLRELMHYRNRYGLLIMTSDDWEFGEDT